MVVDLEEPDSDDRGYPFDHFAVIEYVRALKPEPGLSISQAETIAVGIPDTKLSRAVWTNVLTIAKGNGYQGRHAGNMVDRYQNEMRMIEEGKRESPVATRPEPPISIRAQLERERAGTK